MGNSHGAQNAPRRQDETPPRSNLILPLQTGSPSSTSDDSKAHSHAIEVEEVLLPDEQGQTLEREGDASLDWPGAVSGTAPLYPPVTKASALSKPSLNTHEQRYIKLEDAVRNASNTISSVAGAFVSVLMIAKLIEEVMFMRKLRRELSGAMTPPFSDSSLYNNGTGRGSRHPGTSPDGTHPAPVGDLVGLMGAAVGSLLPSSKSNQGTGNVTWDKVAGLQDVKLLLQEVMVLPSLRPDLFRGIRKPPRGVLLFGPPGTGKTLLARAVATESRSTFIPITGSSILSMWFGQSEQNIKQLFEKARRQAPSVVFIDEVDSLLGRRGGGGPGGGGGGGGESGPDRRVTNEFLSFIDGIQSASEEDSGSAAGEDDCRVTIMAASNNPWDLDEAALSRFSRRVYVPLPDRTTRAMLIKGALKGLECDMSQDDFMRLADKVAHYSGRDLVAVCREAAMQPIRELWGNRLLGGDEGRGEEERAKAARQRLIKVIAEQIGRGTPKRRIRRELEAFRRRQFQQYHEDEAKKAKSQPRTHQPAPGSAAGQDDSSSDARKAALSPSHATKRPEGSSRSSGTCTPSLGNSSQPPSAALASISWLNVDEVMDQAGKLAGENQQKKASQGQGQGQGSKTLTSPPLAPSNNGSNDGPTSRHSSFESERDNVTNAMAPSESNDQAQCTPRSQAAILQAAAEASFSFSASTSTQPPTLPLIKNNRDAFKPNSGASSSQKASDSKKVEEEGGMGVLLSMPANELRPVAFSDFERALAIIMPADFEGLSQKYEDWNRQYGSGADSKRGGAGRGGHYSTMYV